MKQPTLTHRDTGREYPLMEAPNDALAALLEAHCPHKNCSQLTIDISQRIAAIVLAERASAI